jgi:isomaltose glucohydrolase
MTASVSARADSSPAALADLARSSRALITELQDSSGAYPASPTFSAYKGYSWFRDGAFIADGVSAAGAVASASSFFDWCARILESRRAQVETIVASARAGSPLGDDQMLATRFTFDGREGEDDWWDFQTDGYGTWLWAVVEHARRHSLELSPWRGAIDLTVDYLVSSWQRPCFDWWEESHDQIHVSTLGCIRAGLAAIGQTGELDAERGEQVTATVYAIDTLIAERGTVDGHLTKWLGTDAVDASLAAVVLFNAAPVGVAEATISSIESQLVVDGGAHRYLADTFYGGGQWPLLSCMVGLAHVRLGNRDRARELLQWAASTVTPEGFIPEQVGWHRNDPTMTQEWLVRWGSVATPLLWSHAMFVRLAVELGVIDGSPE